MSSAVNTLSTAWLSQIGCLGMTYEAPTGDRQSLYCRWINSLPTLPFLTSFYLSDSLSCSFHTFLVWYLTSSLTLSTSRSHAPSTLLFITSHLSLSLPPTRALYDRVGEAEGDLSFKKDDILYVDESLPKGSFGTWMAWQLDENAQQIQRGQIPSKYMWVHTECGARLHTYIFKPVDTL